MTIKTLKERFPLWIGGLLLLVVGNMLGNGLLSFTGHPNTGFAARLMVLSSALFVYIVGNCIYRRVLSCWLAFFWGLGAFLFPGVILASNMMSIWVASVFPTLMMLAAACYYGASVPPTTYPDQKSQTQREEEK